MRPASQRRISEPKLLVVSPDPESVTDPSWLAPVLGKAAYVYQHTGVMWRTARTIFARGAMTTPHHLRAMVEAVYGRDVEAVPAVLEAAEIQGYGQEGKERAIGAFNVIDIGAGYGRLPSDVRSDEDIGTRLGEPTVTLRLARRENGRLVPWIRADRDARREWALSELRVRSAFWGSATTIPEDAPLLQQARKDWTEWERATVLAEVDADGRLRVEKGNFHYSSSLGLRETGNFSGVGY